MLCRLCIEECKDYQDLYDKDDHKNDIYEVCAKYFEEELAKMEPSELRLLKVICEICWTKIKDFNDYQKSVISAQEQYLTLLSLEKPIKIEQVDIEPTIFTEECEIKQVLDEQPLDVLISAELNESVTEFKLEENGSFANSEDDRVSHSGNDNHDSSDDEESESHDDGKDSEDDDDDEDDKPLAEVFRKRKNSDEKLENRSQIKRVRGRPKTKSEKRSSVPKEEKTPREKSLQTKKTAEHDKFIADWKEILPCELCDFPGDNFTKLKNHFKSQHQNIKPFVKCCGKKYNNRFHLIEHIRIHLDPEAFKCTECGKCSANSRSLASHMKSVHGPQSDERRFECEICHKTFAKKSVLQGHMDIHATGQKDHICPHCGKGFVLENRLKIHIRNIHCAMCVCEQCGRSFRNPYALKDHHMQEHQGIQKPKWPCDQCPAQLNSKYSLFRHKRMAHHDGSTLYVCGECGKVALSEGALLSHKKNVHERPRKFKCTICDKAFKVAQVLREHMTIHTGEELYKCPHCPKTFRVSANMHHHRKRVHPKEWAEKRSQRPYVPMTDMSQVSQKVVL